MNKVMLMGRLTKDPEIRYSQSKNGDQLAIARFSLAVDRRFSRSGQGENEQTADFFNCTSFGRQAEFCEKYLRQGTKIVICGRIENDNYTNKNGEKVYSVKILCEEIEFAESKKAQEGGGYTPQPSAPQSADEKEFISIPSGIEDDLPFK